MVVAVEDELGKRRRGDAKEVKRSDILISSETLEGQERAGQVHCQMKDSLCLFVGAV